MKTISNTELTALTEDGELRADTLSLDGAVMGNGLVLNETDNGRLVIHELSSGRARLIGAFDSAGAALAALDELDLPA